MLLHVPQVLNADQVAQMRGRLDSADWVDGRETVGAQGARVKRNQQLAEQSPLRAELGQLVLDALGRSALFHAAALPARILPPRFNRYSDGGSYGLHVDGAVMAAPSASGAGQLRSDLSATLFLSAPEDYDGGALVIEDTYGRHSARLPAGDLVLYPSSSLHRVEPVTRGVRVAAFFWIQSLVRDDAQRRLLLELDIAIQQLTRKLPDAEELAQLTGVYHNLLRGWAET
ncbi:MAG TPA: Fe2+-dependent dioxygenase [Rhodanobacteraceae bacterium]|nr:Fe2+-dependent dioxygenase [Rhodanobacteraceae bacterium]